MCAVSRGWGRIFSFKLFRVGAKLSTVCINMFSAGRLTEAMKGLANPSQSGVFNQEAFRYLLDSEPKRSERSSHFCQILLVYWTDVQGRIGRMDSDVAKIVMAALSRSLRETDYIGWYREGRIVGAVLTVLAQESMAQVSTHLQPRVLEIIRAELGVEETSHLQIRVCQHHELESIETG